MMKITEQQLRQFIRESLSDQPQPEPEDELLGKYVWPSANKHYNGFFDEVDTDIEEKLYRQLHAFFGTSSYFVKDGPPLDTEAIAAIKQILRSGEYSDIFKICQPRGMMMRGMQVPFDWVKENAPEALLSLPESGNRFEWNEASPVSFPYHSAGKYGKISSWTPNFNSARLFAITQSPNNPVNSIPCIIHASCESGLFMDTTPFARYVGGVYSKEFGIKKLNPQGKKEIEYILFGNCHVVGMQLMNDKETYHERGFIV
jgi:hypothetical protein